MKEKFSKRVIKSFVAIILLLILFFSISYYLSNRYSKTEYNYDELIKELNANKVLFERVALIIEKDSFNFRLSDFRNGIHQNKETKAFMEGEDSPVKEDVLLLLKDIGVVSINESDNFVEFSLSSRSNNGHHNLWFKKKRTIIDEYYNSFLDKVRENWYYYFQDYE